ncbi:MAG: phosphodiester glycosidase family protein, partial [Anaerolineaceae bacterium]|nr:phosphodiester glycosidase family protein [Anaerolineaceae bacterium]
RGSDDLIIYTPQFNSSTPTDDSGAEVILQLSQPLTITPIPNMVKGIVVSIRDGQGNTTIPFDAVVLSASGSAREKLLSNLHEGDEIGISQEIQAYESDCATPQEVDWTSTYASVGGNVTILRDGQAQHDDEAGSLIRSPRTAIAFNDQFIFFIVVDGRQPSISMGMTIDELAAFSRDELGAREGISQDGGGSSTMLINGEVVNVPSDQCHRIYLPDVINPAPETSSIQMVKMRINRVPLIDNGLCERQVANGMMMVVQESAQRSTVFHPSMIVTTTESVDVHLGPGDNFAVFARLPARITGVIQANMNGLDGVMAKGAYWWKATFGPVTGWVRESSLATEVDPSIPREADCSHPSRALLERICPEK